ncbi:hypothetical protein JB92DRAFT_2835762 [Gautieria morchelliformis]|nr:hypothetical protein JB92DRAFT_2835762 [Gautieria morchelliformis]
MTPSHMTTSSGTEHIHISQRQERYKLRPQPIKRTTIAPKQGGRSSKSSGGRVRFEAWETKLLLDTFEAGIWNPGNAIVELLIKDLQGGRSKKQVESWFSHQRRRARDELACRERSREKEKEDWGVEKEDWGVKRDD